MPAKAYPSFKPSVGQTNHPVTTHGPVTTSLPNVLPLASMTTSQVVGVNQARNSFTLSVGTGHGDVQVSSDPTFPANGYETVQAGNQMQLTGWTGPIYARGLTDGPTIMYLEA